MNLPHKITLRTYANSIVRYMVDVGTTYTHYDHTIFMYLVLTLYRLDLVEDL